jgi:hypothetical protein
MKTTLNVHVDILKKIIFAAELQCISSSQMIVILLKQAMNRVGNPDNLGKLVQYQKRSSPEMWHPFHIKWKPDEYEYFQDMKKLLKMSVSLILAIAVKKFLKKLLKQNISDNYRHHNYILVKEVIDGFVLWKLIWGFPLHLEKFIKYH